MAGIEKSINAEGFFGKIVQSVKDSVGSAISNTGSLGTVTIDIKDSRLGAADAGIDRTTAMSKDFEHRPGGGLENYGGDPDGTGSSRWSNMLSGGAIHTMQNVGAFSMRWGGTLSAAEREEAGMWSGMTASPGGRKVVDSHSGLVAGGKRMAELMQEFEAMEKGTPAALRATEQMVHLKESLDALAASGKAGAEAIGGDHGKSMISELDRVHDLAVKGVGGPGGSSGGLTANVGDVMSLVHGDVGGAAQGILGLSMFKTLKAALQAKDLAGASAAFGGGAAGGAAIGGLGLAALYGGFKFGWGIQESSAEAGMRDAGKSLDDYRLSNSLGAGFDFRGMTYISDRTTGDKNGRHSHQNTAMARRMLAGMGLGAGGWSGGHDGLYDTAHGLHGRALAMGVDDGALAGFVGASIRSGETGRSDSGVEGLLKRVGGLIAEGNKAGVSSNEKLGVLVSLRQGEQARLGFVSEGSTRYMENVSRVLDSAGPAALKGQGGAASIQKLAGNENMAFNAMLSLNFLDSNGKLTPEAWDQWVADCDGNPDLAAELLQENGAQWVAMKLSQKGGNRSAFSRHLLGGALKGTNGFIRGLVTMNDPNMNTRDAMALHFLERGKDPGSMRDADGPGSSIPTAARLEAENYQQVAALGAMKTEILETTRALGDMKNFMRANFTMTDFKKDFQRAAWDSIDNPFDSGILFSLLGPAGLGPAAVKQATRGQR